MTATYGINDARPILGDLVTAVEQGAEIVLTRRGRPVARLTAYTQEPVVPTNSTTFSRDITADQIEDHIRTHTPAHDSGLPDWVNRGAREVRIYARTAPADRELDVVIGPSIGPATVLRYVHTPPSRDVERFVFVQTAYQYGQADTDAQWDDWDAQGGNWSDRSRPEVPRGDLHVALHVAVKRLVGPFVESWVAVRERIGTEG